MSIDTINEKSFLIDPLNANNALYRDSLTLRATNMAKESFVAK